MAWLLCFLLSSRFLVSPCFLFPCILVSSPLNFLHPLYLSLFLFFLILYFSVLSFFLFLVPPFFFLLTFYNSIFVILLHFMQPSFFCLFYHLSYSPLSFLFPNYVFLLHHILLMYTPYLNTFHCVFSFFFSYILHTRHMVCFTFFSLSFYHSSSFSPAFT